MNNQKIVYKITQGLFTILQDFKYSLVDKDDNITEKILPVVYGQKEKIVHDYLYAKKRTDIEKNIEVAYVIPLLAVKIVNLSRSPENKTSKNKKITINNKTQYTPVPITINYNCSVITHQMLTLTDIWEQLMKKFDNEYNINMQFFGQNSESVSLTYKLTNTNFSISDDYGEDENRAVYFDFNIDVDGFVYKTEQTIFEQTVDMNIYNF
jgi:hypothetical protein